MSAPSHNPLVLVAEDNEDHLLLTKVAFEHANVPVDLEWVRDGLDCMDYLLRRNGREAARRPDLLLLDIHMPRMSGIEVMQQILKHDDLRALPVIVLSTSDAPSDVRMMYELRVNSYLKKPLNFEEYMATIATMSRYWFNTALIPFNTQ